MFTVIYKKEAFDSWHLEPRHTEDEAMELLKDLARAADCEAVMVEGKILASLNGNIMTHHRQAKDTRR